MDLLLYPNDARRVRDALEQALASGALRADAAGRVAPPLRARARHGHEPDAAGDAAARSSRPMRWPTRCWSRECCAATRPRLHGPLDLVVVDDDLGGPYPAGSERLDRAAARPRAGRPLQPEARASCSRSPSRAPGRAARDSAPESRDALANAVPGADLIVLFGHPRLLPELPTDAPVLLAWHRQRLMQEAVGRWLTRRLA